MCKDMDVNGNWPLWNSLTSIIVYCLSGDNIILTFKHKVAHVAGISVHQLCTILSYCYLNCKFCWRKTFQFWSRNMPIQSGFFLHEIGFSIIFFSMKLMFHHTLKVPNFQLWCWVINFKNNFHFYLPLLVMQKV